MSGVITPETITTGDGCRIAYRFDGPEDAPVLLLSNSLGTDRDMWSPQMAAFAERFRVLRYDTRGHGQSDAPAGLYSLDRMGRDIIELLDALGLESVDFCGLSLGGMMGQWLGIHAPDRVRRIVLANTSSYMGPPANWDARIATVKAQGMAPLAEASAERWFSASFRETGGDAIAPIVATLLKTDPAGYAGACGAAAPAQTRRDARTAPARARQIVRAIRAPDRFIDSPLGVAPHATAGNAPAPPGGRAGALCLV